MGLEPQGHIFMCMFSGVVLEFSGVVLEYKLLKFYYIKGITLILLLKDN